MKNRILHVRVGGECGWWAEVIVPRRAEPRRNLHHRAPPHVTTATLWE